MLIDHRNHHELLGGQTEPGDRTRQFSGVFVARSGLPAIVTAQNVVATFDFATAKYDDGGWFDVSTPTFVTVPDGVTRVRDSISVLPFASWGVNDVLICSTAINGVINQEAGRLTHTLQASGFTNWYRVSPVYDVSPGDEISVQVIATTLTPATYQVFGGDSTTLAVEAVTMEF